MEQVSVSAIYTLVLFSLSTNTDLNVDESEFKVVLIYITGWTLVSENSWFSIHWNQAVAWEEMYASHKNHKKSLTLNFQHSDCVKRIDDLVN